MLINSIDTRERIPSEFTALKCSKDGNSLYNAVSILLYGTEDFSLHLRLAVIVHSAEHIEHYIEMVYISVCIMYIRIHSFLGL